MIWKLLPHFRKPQTGTSWELLEAVITAIRAEPKRVHMDSWVLDKDKASDLEDTDKFPICGTQGCIAGWMHLATAPKVEHTMADSSLIAMALLPITVRGDASDLFNGRIFNKESIYPFPPHADGTPKDQKRYANDVVKNIRLFMKKHKKALQSHTLNVKAVYANVSFAAIAAALAMQKPNDAYVDVVSPSDQWYRIVHNLADVLGASNPKFNRKRFLVAAGAL